MDMNILDRALNELTRRGEIIAAHERRIAELIEEIDKAAKTVEDLRNQKLRHIEKKLWKKYPTPSDPRAELPF